MAQQLPGAARLPQNTLAQRVGAVPPEQNEPLPIPAQKPTGLASKLPAAGPARSTNELDAEIARRSGGVPEGSELDAEIMRRSGGTPGPADFPSGFNDPGMGGPGDPYELIDGVLQSKPLADTFLAASVGQKTLGPAGFDNMIERTGIGLTDTFEEKDRLFRRFYPQGELRQILVPPDLNNTSEAGQVVTLFRRRADEPWARFDEPTLSGGDVADVSATGVQVGAGIGAAFATRGTGLLWQMTMQGLAAAGSDTARQELLRLSGIKDEPRGNSMRRSLVEGGIASLGYMATVPFVGLGKPLLGLGGGNVGPEGVAAVDAARRQGFILPYAFEVAENPMIQRIGSQAMAQITVVGERVAAQHRKVLDMLKQRVDYDVLEGGLDVLGQIEENSRLKLMRTVSSFGPASDDFTSGLAVQQGLQEWDRAVTTQLSDLYGAARSFRNVSFDLAPAKQFVAEVRARQAAGEITNMPAEINTLLQRIERAPPMLTDQYTDTGPFWHFTGAPEILDAWRSHAFKAQQGVIGQFRVGREQGLALELFNRLSGVFDNPVGIADVLSPDGTATRILTPLGSEANFADIWAKARSTAKTRFQTLDALNKLTTATERELDPVALARRMLSAPNEAAVSLVYSTLRSQGLEARWDAMVQGAKTHLLDTLVNDGSEAAATMLSKYSDRSRVLLFGGADELAGLQNAIGLKKQIEQLGIGDVLREQGQAGAAVIQMIKNADQEGLKRLLAVPAESPLRQTIRYGLLDSLYAMRRPFSGTGPMRGVEVLDGQRVRQALKQMNESGAAKFLTPEDIQFLTDAEQYLRFVPSGVDSGTSIVAGQTAQEITHVSDPGRIMAAVGTLVRMVGFGRLVSNNAGRYLILGLRPGRGNETVKNLMRTTGSILLDTAHRLNVEKTEGGLRGPDDVTEFLGGTVRGAVQEGLEGARELVQ